MWLLVFEIFVHDLLSLNQMKSDIPEQKPNQDGLAQVQALAKSTPGSDIVKVNF